MYEFLLLAHIAGALALFGAITLEQAAVHRLQRASTVSEVSTCAGLVQTTGPLHPLSTLLLLVAGVWMTIEQWTFTSPWILTSLVAFVVIAGLGPSVLSAEWDTIQRLADESPDGPVPAPLRDELVERRFWVLTQGTTGLVVGIVVLMVLKPGWAGPIAALAVAVAGGVALGVWGSRQVAAHGSAALLSQAQSVESCSSVIWNTSRPSSEFRIIALRSASRLRFGSTSPWTRPAVCRSRPGARRWHHSVTVPAAFEKWSQAPGAARARGNLGAWT